MDMELNNSIEDKSNSDDPVELDESKLSVANTSLAEPPTTPGSAKMSKALKAQIRMEMEKKRKEEREKQELAKQERNRQREELKKKKEEEERERKRKLEEQKKKREEERAKKEAEELERKKKLEEAKQKREEERAKKEAEELERKKKLEEAKQKREEEKAEKERQRLEQINAKNEEKKKKEEERLRREEEERRKTEKLKITSYFVKKESSNPSDRLEKVYRFMPFEPKPNMTIAPLCRRSDLINMTEDEHNEYIHKLDEQMLYRTDDDTESTVPNYLEEIRQNPSLVRKNLTSFRKPEKKDLDVKEIIVSNKTKFKVKYLHFDRKVFKRPPYYGTWRKESENVKPRRPFGKDTKLDYDVDSDDEWEDEPEGESINGSSDVEDEEEADEDEDDGFFVPHGYLSDEELDEEEREMNMEEKKAKHALKVQQYELESRRGKRVLVPKCFIDSKYLNQDSTETSGTRSNPDDLKMLERLQMVPLVNTLPVVITIENENQKPIQLGDESTPKAKGHKGEGKSKQSAASKQATPVIVAAATSSSATQPASASPAPANNTPSIIKFISKMSNKNIKIEQLGSSKSSDDNVAGKMIVDDEPQIIKKDSKIEIVGIETTTAVVASPVIELKKLNESCSDANTPKSSHQPEKRACTDKTENKIVKRLKLDSLDKAINLSKSDQKKANTPSIVDLFKGTACKRALKLNEDESSDQPAGGQQTLANGDSKLNTVVNSPSKKLRETKQSPEIEKTDKENSDSPSPIVVE